MCGNNANFPVLEDFEPADVYYEQKRQKWYLIIAHFPSCSAISSENIFHTIEVLPATRHPAKKKSDLAKLGKLSVIRHSAGIWVKQENIRTVG